MKFCVSVVLLAVFSPAGVSWAGLLDEITEADLNADAEVAAIATRKDLAARQDSWRKSWLAGIGGLPERTPLNAQPGDIVKCDGFTFRNILFESQPGVFVVGHLALPDSPRFKPPYPAVLMPMGHSDNGILNPRYAAHLAMMARAGFAAFSWDPISQGERRQSKPEYDYRDNCSTEHARLGFRGWLVGWNFARLLVWDGMRALDYLETRADVDCSNVGICGTSGGGTQSAYLQALDSRIRVAFPNCFVSSIRSVFRERGCHDAEQFFWKQLTAKVNHAAILAMGAGRVSLATGSRWKDYFPHAGAVETFAVHSNLTERLALSDCGPWHFHCDGPHGLPLPTRQAQVDWMAYCLRHGPRPKPLLQYWNLSTGDHSGTNDPCATAVLPFPKGAAFFTAGRNVRTLPGFKSVYDLLAERAKRLAQTRKPHSRERLREIVRRRARIRPLAELCGDGVATPFDHQRFDWWYLKGAYGCRRENEAAIMATLGRSVVGRDAERIILRAVDEIREAHQGVSVEELSSAGSRFRVRLCAIGADCIAAAHAFAAEPQLFSEVKFADLPVSWTEMVVNPNPESDSFAIAVWGALEEYDWRDLVPSGASVVTSPTSVGQGFETDTSQQN